ncbi:MAG: hypothetical protein WB557_21275 [Solirubrobacteraceae bacterium]
MAAEQPHSLKPSSAAKRRYRTGSIFEKRNAWYGQWHVRNRTITRQLVPIRTPLPGAPRPSVAPSRLGRQEVRFAPPGRSFEIAPAAGGRGAAGVVGGVVVVQLLLSPLGDQAEDAQV